MFDFHHLYSLRLLWEIMKQDVRSTLKSVCYKVLHDRSVDEEVRDKRAEALLILGEVLYNHNIDESASLRSLSQFIGDQAGLSAQESANDEDTDSQQTNNSNNNDNKDSNVNNNVNDKSNTDSTVDLHTLQTLHKRLCGETSEPLSVKEMKKWFAEFGEDSTSFFEKSELTNRLKEIVESRIEQLAK